MSDETKAKMAAGRRRYLEERRAAKERELAEQEQRLAEDDDPSPEELEDAAGAHLDEEPEIEPEAAPSATVRARVTVWTIEGPPAVVAEMIEQITSGEG